MALMGWVKPEFLNHEFSQAQLILTVDLVELFGWGGLTQLI